MFWSQTTGLCDQKSTAHQLRHKQNKKQLNSTILISHTTCSQKLDRIHFTQPSIPHTASNYSKMQPQNMYHHRC